MIMSKPVIQVSRLSKRFSKNLKHGMINGLMDIMGGIMQGSQDEAVMPKLRTSEFWALRDISFSIEAGERVGIIGPNGAGKSTLFSILSGIYGPSSGRIEVRGQLQALIALGAGFHPMLTGRENVFINAAVLGMNTRQIEEKLDEIIGFSGLGEFIDMPVKRYSSGMLVRLGFAIAAHMDPDIMLIDEVLAVGDAQFQNKCIEFTKKMKDRNRTVVLVSHNLAQVQKVCDRTLWMDEGRIRMDGETDAVLREYSAWALHGMANERCASVCASHEVQGSCLHFNYSVKNQEKALSDLTQSYGELPTVVRGSMMQVCIDYTVHEAIRGKLNFYVHVKDAISGVRIFGCTGSKVGCLCLARLGERRHLLVEFPDVPLNEGLYNLDIGVVAENESGMTRTLAKVYETQPSFVCVAPEKGQVRPPHAIATMNRHPLVEWPGRMIAEGDIS